MIRELQIWLINKIIFNNLNFRIPVVDCNCLFQFCIKRFLRRCFNSLINRLG